MGTNFYFDEAKMTAWKSLPKTEFMRLFPTVTEHQIINTARMELHNTNLSTVIINKSEHNTEIFSKSY